MPLLSKKICDTITMDFNSLIENKSGLGTAGVVVINKDPRHYFLYGKQLQDFINMRVVNSVHLVERA